MSPKLETTFQKSWSKSQCENHTPFYMLLKIKDKFTLLKTTDYKKTSTVVGCITDVLLFILFFISYIKTIFVFSHLLTPDVFVA